MRAQVVPVVEPDLFVAQVCFRRNTNGPNVNAKVSQCHIDVKDVGRGRVPAPIERQHESFAGLAQNTELSLDFEAFNHRNDTTGAWDLVGNLLWLTLSRWP